VTAGASARANVYVLQARGRRDERAGWRETIAGRDFLGSDNPLEGIEPLCGATGATRLALDGTGSASLLRVARESAAYFEAEIEPERARNRRTQPPAWRARPPGPASRSGRGPRSRCGARAPRAAGTRLATSEPPAGPRPRPDWSCGRPGHGARARRPVAGRRRRRTRRAGGADVVGAVLLDARYRGPLVCRRPVGTPAAGGHGGQARTLPLRGCGHRRGRALRRGGGRLDVGSPRWGRPIARSLLLGCRATVPCSRACSSAPNRPPLRRSTSTAQRGHGALGRCRTGAETWKGPPSPPCRWRSPRRGGPGGGDGGGADRRARPGRLRRPRRHPTRGRHGRPGRADAPEGPSLTDCRTGWTIIARPGVRAYPHGRIAEPITSSAACRASASAGSPGRRDEGGTQRVRSQSPGRQRRGRRRGRARRARPLRMEDLERARGARVDHVDRETGPATGRYEGFSIRG